MSSILYQDDNHKCIKFDDLTPGGEIQSNQFLIVHNRRGMLIDCGGYRIYQHVLGAIARHIPAGSLDFIFLSHQDPDIGSGLNLWLPICQAQIVVSALWTRFIPAFCVRGLADERILPLPDNGMILRLAGSPLVAVPAHFMHSPGNFQLYDPVAKILFSGDLGSSINPPLENVTTAAEFDRHVETMTGFHRRYISSRKACMLWAAMVRKLDIEMIVPQHGARISGRDMVERFYRWIENEPAAVDDFAHTLYVLPDGAVEL